MKFDQPTHSLFDRTSFDRIAEQAKSQRATFMRKNPLNMLIMGGFIVAACAIGFVLSPMLGVTGPGKEAIAKLESQSASRTSNATAQIEKINALLENINSIAPNTAREITQLIHQPSYDCNLVPCSSALQRRNYVARSQLEALLAKKTLPDENSIHATSHEPTKIVDRLK
jgi:hypothetical protein